MYVEVRLCSNRGIFSRKLKDYKLDKVSYYKPTLGMNKDTNLFTLSILAATERKYVLSIYRVYLIHLMYVLVYKPLWCISPTTHFEPPNMGYTIYWVYKLHHVKITKQDQLPS